MLWNSDRPDPERKERISPVRCRATVDHRTCLVKDARLNAVVWFWWNISDAVSSDSALEGERKEDLVDGVRSSGLAATEGHYSGH